MIRLWQSFYPSSDLSRYELIAETLDSCWPARYNGCYSWTWNGLSM